MSPPTRKRPPYRTIPVGHPLYEPRQRTRCKAMSVACDYLGDRITSLRGWKR